MPADIQVPEVSVRETCRILREEPDAVLLNVRTAPEWDFVGVPLVSNHVQVEWRLYPHMTINPDFRSEVEALGLPKRGRILCLCKSGGGS